MKKNKKEIPVVAIVGRPNVGKSALFNKIIGQRKAIVNDTEGLTRDRNYNRASFEGKDFILIDTGGFEPVSKDNILMQVKEQAQLAIDESDIIIFLCDGKTGITNDDIEIFNFLRKTEKPIVVSINKIDDSKHKERVYDFYKLGTDQLLAISAEHSIGISDLLNTVCNFLPDYKEIKYPDTYIRVSVVGRPNVGKSSLINKIINEKRVLVDKSPGTTRDSIDTYFKRDEKEFLFIDTAGIRRKGRVTNVLEKYCVIMALKSLERSDIALILIDATDGITAQDTKIAGYAYEAGKACIIVVNKWDLVEKDNKTTGAYTTEIKNKLKYLSFAPVIFVSAETGQRINKLFPLIEEIFKEYNKKLSTSKLNRIIKKIWDKRHPSSYRGKAVKFYYSTQIKSGPPTFLIFVNYSKGIHFSYMRYIENGLRNEFGFFGTPLRILLRDRR
ncbi:MAG TPA: ribosome biogenesis GTPase Der [Nitrospinota bacterium]|nr:ribosome biogenesis GTPase Der [Nitrospinota bacterium]